MKLNLRTFLFSVIILFAIQTVRAQDTNTKEEYEAFTFGAHLKNMHLWHGFVVHPGALFATNLEYNSKNSKFTISTIDEAANDADISSFLRIYMGNEVTPTLGDLEGVNLKNYKFSLIQRFGNTYIKDQIERICSESSAKIPIFILPTVYAQLENNGAIHHAAFIIAAFAIYSVGVNENGSQLIIKDAMKSVLNEKAILSRKNPKAFLEIEAIFGKLKDSKVFLEAYTNAYNAIIQNGIEKSVKDINSTILNEI
ncbi:hypothetical protein [uncultured Polaribacter sp.]|uniref:mannitol dehydrogenase family protein n=1 Tax=uncultured Polaribacter sp. TaxID=174711 RepID=UPI0030D7DEF4|tara:strand:+ start:696 stop:1457 length:762 start_codon:yes stop_codon:yes gene_type:complete